MSTLVSNVPIVNSLEVSPLVCSLPIALACPEAKPCQAEGRAFRAERRGGQSDFRLTQPRPRRPPDLHPVIALLPGMARRGWSAAIGFPHLVCRFGFGRLRPLDNLLPRHFLPSVVDLQPAIFPLADRHLGLGRRILPPLPFYL